jgi:hypothetical protein
VEPLENRHLLSGLSSQLDILPSLPAGYGSAVLALRLPSGAGRASQDPVHRAEALASALVTAAEAGAPDLAPFVNAAASAVQAFASHVVIPKMGSALGGAAAEGGQPGGPLSTPPDQRAATDPPKEGNLSGVSLFFGTVWSHLPPAEQSRLLETGQAVDLAPLLEVSASPTAAPKEPARAAITTAVREFVGYLSGPHGPPLPPDPLGILGKELWRELHEVRNELALTSLAVPVREGDPPNSALLASTRPHHGFLPFPTAAVDPERQGAVSTPQLLAPALSRGGSWLWGLSADGVVADPAGDPATQGEMAWPLVSPSSSDPQIGAADAEVNLPEDAGLAAGFVPVNTAALAQAVQRFLGELGAAGRELTHLLSENPWARWAVIVSASALTAELGRRRVRRAARHRSDEEEEAATLSWPANSYPFHLEDSL